MCSVNAGSHYFYYYPRSAQRRRALGVGSLARDLCQSHPCWKRKGAENGSRSSLEVVPVMPPEVLLFPVDTIFPLHCTNFESQSLLHPLSGKKITLFVASILLTREVLSLLSQSWPALTSTERKSRPSNSRPMLGYRLLWRMEEINFFSPWFLFGSS